ncbi:MAG: S8 family serine peptidase [Sedimentisphaerales bacterium]|nr:S8 family serine peptidase [Sedimentisphaerales bacterium]
MSKNEARRNWTVLFVSLLIFVLIAQSSFAGTTEKELSPRLQKFTALMDPNTEHSPASGPGYMPGEVIIKLRADQTGGISLSSASNPAARDKAALLRLQAKYGLQEEGPVFKGARRRLERQGTAVSASASMRRSRNLDLSRFYLLKTEENVRAICSRLQNDPDIEYAQPNYIYKRCAEPNDPEYFDQYAHQLIQMTDAWDISIGSHDVVVAVLDTGVDINHPDLKNNIWINKVEIPNNYIDDDNNGYIDDTFGWNFEQDNNDVLPDESFDSIVSHGTNVAGVIAAEGNNGEGVAGINWRCSIMALRISPDITSTEVAKGLDYAAANGANILNMSFGGDTFGPEGDLIVKEAIDNAYNAGILLTGSAGNDDTAKPNYPAAYYNVMAVASTDGEDIKTGHSSFGPWVDITAPGTDIVTTDLGGEYIATAGTSFSAPYVGAVGALVLSYKPDLTNMELRAILENTTDPVYYGQVDPIINYIGTGRVNAYQALLGADTRYPLGEIAEPIQAESFSPDVNNISIVFFVLGDTYRLEYSQYDSDNWIPIADGNAPLDPNGLVEVSMDNPGVGTFDLRLSVNSDGYTHTDRKVFSISMATEQINWPKPEEVDLTSDTVDIFYGGSIFMDVDGDSRNEIIQPILSWEEWWTTGSVAIWDENGTPLPGWPQSLFESWDPPRCAVGDIDGDGDFEVIGTFELDGLVCAWHAENGQVVDGDWPLDIGQWYGWIVANPVLADLDGDGDSEIIAALDLETGSIDGLYAIQGDGSFLWQRRYTTQGAMSVADFDKDGNIEIALCGKGPGISTVYTYILDNQGQQIKRWRGGSNMGTAIADLDADGELELVYCTEDSVRAVHIDGNTVWRTDVDSFGESGAFSIGDINNDGFYEVYITSYMESDGYSFTIVHVFDHQGKLLSDSGYPKIIVGTTYYNPPLIGDIDGDGQKEVVVAMSATPVIAWEADGSTTPGFPILDLWAELGCIPSIGDLDQDGDIELMVGGYDYRFHVIDLPGMYDSDTIDWGMYRHDPQCSGWAVKGPQLEFPGVPEQIKPGERLKLTLSASNPTNLPLHYFVGNLPEGAYYDVNALTVYWKPTADQISHTYTFSFMVTNGVQQSSRSVSITVVPDAIYYTDMSVDPNWLLDEGWAWGIPTGHGSWNGDPNAAYTGQNVIGYNLDGDYTDSMNITRYATLGPLNCEEYTNIWLSFRRWLGVESPYDKANIQVSNDGTNWVDIWKAGNSHISDDSWQLMEYTVPSNIADGQSAVYFRWGIGPTDESVTYPGWNIDDVHITGDRIE